MFKATIGMLVLGVSAAAAQAAWAQDAANDTDAYWGYIYNSTQVGGPGLAFLDLGGPVDMSAGSLTITWNASGIITITNP